MRANPKTIIIYFSFILILVPHASYASHTNIPASSNIQNFSVPYFSVCPNYPSNPTSGDVFRIINQTKNEDMLGACALATLLLYNSSGALSALNISINLNSLYENFMSGNPSVSLVPNATAPNTTSLPGISFQQPSLHCVVKPSFNSSSLNTPANKTRILACNEKTVGKVNRFDIPIPSNVSRGPEVIDISNASNGTTIISFQNHTLVVNIVNQSRVHVLPKMLSSSLSEGSNTSSDPSPWAGYVASSGSPQAFEVSGSWVVQDALQSPTTRMATQWIGIGGVGTDSTLIQVGTVSCWSSVIPSHCNYYSTGARYFAFLQLVQSFTSAETIGTASNPFPVNVGDKISASITLVYMANLSPATSVKQFKIVISDTKADGTTITNTSYVFYNQSSLLTQDWIDERPTVYLCDTAISCYANFTNFINASFTNAPSFLLPNIGYVSITGDLGDSAIPTVRLSDSSFKIQNLRFTSVQAINGTFVPKLVTNRTNVFPGQSINLSAAIAGGTGFYSLTWLVNNAAQLSNCPESTGSLGNTHCIVTIGAATTPGNYLYTLSATPIGGPTNERINSTVLVSVNPSVAISITNNQNIETPSPFQQMLVIDSRNYPQINSNWNNVEFTTGSYATGTPLQAWVESNASSSSTHTIVWVNLPYSISGYGSTTIYMNVMPTPVMSSGGPTGEAPQLSPTYAEYDNGASVFNFYDNFRGTSLSSSWTHTTNAAISVNNGLGITFSGLDAYIVTNSHYGVGTAFDSDITYFEDNSFLAANSTNETDPDDMGYININQPQSTIGNSGWSATMIRAACNNLYPTQISPSGETNPCGRVFGAFVYGYIPIGIYTVNPTTASSSFQYVGYSTYNTRQPITGDAPNYPASVGYAQMSYGSYTNRINVQWARVRNAPPNGIMPTINVI